MKSEKLITPYVNWKGNYKIREIYPCKIEFQDYNNWHGEDCWILTSVAEDNTFKGFDFDGIVKGIVHHTLREMAITSTPERIQGIVDNIKRNYHADKS